MANIKTKKTQDIGVEVYNAFRQLQTKIKPPPTTAELMTKYRTYHKYGYDDNYIIQRIKFDYLKEL